MVMATTSIDALVDERQAAIDAAKAICAKAKEAGEELTDEQCAEVETLTTKAKALKAEIEAETAKAAKRAALSAALDEEDSWGGQAQRQISTPPDPSAGMTLQTQVSNPRLAALDDPNRGYQSQTEFLTSIFEAARTGQITDERLRPLAAAGSDEQGAFADPYGGFLLPRGFSPNLLSVEPEADPIAGRTTPVPMEAAVVDVAARVDKDHSDSVSGGLRVYRRAEGDTSASSRMEVEAVSLKAHSMFGIAYATEELLQRSPRSFIALLEAGFRDEFAAKHLSERLNGSGVGMMEGALNSPCCITVDKESGQAADTIVYQNIVKMRARCWRYGKAIWTANHDTLEQLMQLTIDVGTSGTPVWQPSAREDHPDLLLGRPLFFTEFAETVGDLGDIFLGNWSQYLEGTLTPLDQAESIHVRFINHERTFKFWLENDGRCWWRSPLTPKNGATLSPFVKLQAR